MIWKTGNFLESFSFFSFCFSQLPFKMNYYGCTGKIVFFFLWKRSTYLITMTRKKKSYHPPKFYVSESLSQKLVMGWIIFLLKDALNMAQRSFLRFPFCSKSLSTFFFFNESWIELLSSSDKLKNIAIAKKKRKMKRETWIIWDWFNCKFFRLCLEHK